MTERLTEIKYNGIVSKKREETGISCSQYCTSCSQGGGNCEYVSEMIKKLAEYETAEEEGRLVVLPCKNWLDIVFGEQELFYGIDMDYIENPIREITAHNEERFTWYDGWKTLVLKGVDENGLDWEFAPEEIGKTVFLARGEAEKSLKEMEENHE